MATFMNEYDVARVVGMFSGDERYPNLGLAAQVLDRLMDWTNENSDGWPYWAKPRQAAANLIGQLQDAQAQVRIHTLQGDIPDRDLQRALRPVKAFLTRQGVDWNADLPWAALFPAA
jgi:hypothetical protein